MIPAEAGTWIVREDDPGAGPDGPSVLFFSAAGPVSAVYRDAVPPGWRFAALTSNDDEDEKIRLIAEADLLIHTDQRIERQHLEAAGRLRIAHRQGVGTDALDLGLLREFGVRLAICPDGTPEAVAEHAVMLMLAAGRHLVELHRDVTERGRWPKWDYRPRSIGLAGSRVGLIGFGRIGQAAAERVLAFGSDVTVWRRDERPLPAGWDGRVTVTRSLEDLFSTCDIISLHCPLNDDTRGLIDGRLLALMGPHSVIVNTARGAVIVEEDLIEALRAGRPGMAGLDCLTVEPAAPDNPLFSMPNVIVTPHMAAGTISTQLVKARAVFANLRRGWMGEPLENEVLD